MNAVVRVVLAVTGVIAAFALAAVLLLGVSARTPPFIDAAGNEINGSIAVLEKIRLGGLDQWVLIRGADRANPILLWLHGGPGAAQMAFAHHLDRELEEHFVVVHWDQPGAGKSNHRGFDKRTMRVERYLQDARELVDHLRERLGQERIVLLGHSWGSQLGMELARANPERFHAFIGVGQAVNHERATEIARDWLLATIDPEEDPEDLLTLQEIEIPARRHGEYRRLNRLVNARGGSFDLSMGQLARIAVRAPEYTVLDYLRLLDGMNRGGGPMHAGGTMAGYDLIATVPAVDVPVYFFAGARDYNTPLALTREYFDSIRAPHKELIVFENSAHLPFFAEREKFVRQVIRIGAESIGPVLRQDLIPLVDAAHALAIGQGPRHTRGLSIERSEAAEPTA